MNPKSESYLSALQSYLAEPLDELLGESAEQEAEERALELFHEVAESVPAYGAFLREQGLGPEMVRTVEDFRGVPPVTKENYVLRYPLPDLCRGGRLEECDMVAVSSGSTGRPTIWPRFQTHELPTTVRFEQVFHDSFRADERRTLAVVCFALGTWVGGMYTASCCRRVAAKGYLLTVATPGNNREEIYRTVQELGPYFDQVVMLGYPPFLKDVIDTGIARGMDWKPYRIKLVMAGEVFSEEWRSLVGERTGSDAPCYDSASLYGTADAGVLANETPLSICIRRFLARRPDAARALFGEPRLPTLAQYDPRVRFFEAHNGRLLFTGDNGVPLIRYNILDSGGVIPFDSMMRFLSDQGCDDELVEAALSGRPPAVRGVRRLPFVYVFGRSHFAVSYFGANIYPENVMVGLEQPEIRDWSTGKFVLEVREDADRNRYLSVTVELAPGQAASEERRAAAEGSIRQHLERLNSEFAHYVPPEYRTPRVTLLPFADPSYFPPGIKHRYTRE